MRSTRESTHRTALQCRIVVGRSTDERELAETLVLAVGTISGRDLFDIRHRQLEFLPWIAFEDVAARWTLTLGTGSCFRSDNL